MSLRTAEDRSLICQRDDCGHVIVAPSALMELMRLQDHLRDAHGEWAITMRDALTIRADWEVRARDQERAGKDGG